MTTNSTSTEEETPSDAPAPTKTKANIDERPAWPLTTAIVIAFLAVTSGAYGGIEGANFFAKLVPTLVMMIGVAIFYVARLIGLRKKNRTGYEVASERAWIWIVVILAAGVVGVWIGGATSAGGPWINTFFAWLASSESGWKVTVILVISLIIGLGFGLSDIVHGSKRSFVSGLAVTAGSAVAMFVLGGIGLAIIIAAIATFGFTYAVAYDKRTYVKLVFAMLFTTLTVATQHFNVAATEPPPIISPVVNQDDLTDACETDADLFPAHCTEEYLEE